MDIGKTSTHFIKPLTKHEQEVCWLTWGCIPIDVAWVRNSKLFQEKQIEYENKLCKLI